MIVFNLANMLTLSRLVIAVAFFILMGFKSWWTVPVLLLAGVTDVLDGWVARRYNQQTDFGRIADPAIDKVLICCGFILLVAIAPKIVRPWMAAIIVGRELVVTALRSLAESRGTEFAATFWGKSKMAVQFTTLGYVILVMTAGYLEHDWVRTVGLVLVWTTIVVTVMSGLVYIVQAQRLVRGKRDS